jgi:hypothetical protein
MVIDETYLLDTTDLCLVRYDMNVKTVEIVNFMLEKLTDTEVKLIKFLTQEVPFRSSMEDEESYWDIIFLDSKVRVYLEHLLTKYGIRFEVSNITNLYYEKSKELDRTFIKEIDEYVDSILDTDKVLERISKFGMDNIKKYEYDFLERQSKK